MKDPKLPKQIFVHWEGSERERYLTVLVEAVATEGAAS